MTTHAFAAIAVMVLTAPIVAPVAAEQGEHAPTTNNEAAQVGAENHPPPEGRTLNGHTFLPAASVRGPFLVTAFGSFMNIGYGSSSGAFQIGDRVFKEFDYALFGATLDYELAFLRYFSARLALNPDVFSGVNGDSALVVGSRLQVGASAGLTASIPLGDAIRVGFLLDASFGPDILLSIGEGIRAIVDSCQQRSGCNIDTAHVFNILHVFTLQPAAAAGWAPFPPLGLTASLAYLYATESSSGSSINGQAVVTAFAADFDFARISSVPVGIQFQFRWTAPFSGTQLQHITDLGGGVFYTGRQDLAAGLQLIFRRSAVTSEVDVSWSNLLTTIGLRYYW